MQEIPQNPQTETPTQEPVQPTLHSAPTGMPAIVWIVAGVAVLSLLANAYFFLNRPATNSPQNTETAIETELETAQPRATPTTKEKLAVVLSQECQNKVIDLSVLPFVISPALQAKYDITCQEPESLATQRYLELFMTDNIEDENSMRQYMYIYHPQSKYNGFGNILIDSETATSFNINGKQYLLEVLEPGPYGISSQAVIVELTAKKTDPVSESTVKVFSSSNFIDAKTLELVNKYGSKPEGVEADFPVIVDDKQAFKNDLLQLLQTNGTEANTKIKEMAASVDTDLAGITF